MKNFLITLSLVFAVAQFGNAQETEQPVDSVLIAQEQMKKLEQEIEADKAAQKEIEKAEKAQKKAEKAQKKAEKAVKKQEKLTKAIASKKKGIKKSEAKIRKLQNKMAKNKSKGKVSPVDEMEINQKINKLELSIAKDKEKLGKLQQKQ